MSESSMPVGAEPYRVLARKYRPQTFEALVGQDAMVRTLRNAIETQRLAHAFIMTGVRGVGKTTTARLIARALNCIGPDGTGAETITPCGQCEHCQMIAGGTHPDVIEMDAASNTSVNDVRTIIENVPYAAASARYKIYIIDEVHMLSNSAFNALLKTLEEPPPHVKFIFATTEIRKVPVTVLSRCQRFDLKRIDEDQLAAHFRSVCDQEGVAIEDEALALLARAAQGSVRDGLSLLDQAIAHAGGSIEAAQVRAMIGLADPGHVDAIAEACFVGQPDAALTAFATYYENSGDPIVLVEALLDLTHRLTKQKVFQESGHPLAGKLSVPALNTAWQILSKGLAEVRSASRAAQAAEMLLVRLAYAATLPSPADLAKAAQSNGATQAPPTLPPIVEKPVIEKPSVSTATSGAAAVQAAAAQPAPVESSAPEPAKPMLRLVEPDADEGAALDQFEALVQRLDDSMEGILAYKLRNAMRLVAIDMQAGTLRLAPTAAPDGQFKSDLMAALQNLFGQAWTLHYEKDSAHPTLAERSAARQAEIEARAKSNPGVKAALEMFPGAQITAVRSLTRPDIAAHPPLQTAPDGYEVLPDSAYEDDMDDIHPFDPELPQDND
ncbi:MAG: DNA polymerase III subunit gamma/tau [Sphingomonadales bacterium]